MEFNSAEDFLKNQSFVNYCLEINQEDILFWKDYIVKNPDKLIFVNEARELVKDLQLLLVAEQLKPRAIARLREHIATKEKRRTISLWRYIASAAAIFLVVAAAAFLFYQSQNQVVKPELANFAAHKYFFDAGTDERKAINLWDGSFVILDKGAKLTIDSTFGQTDRKMHLSGTAYFKVAKNKLQPFKVYTGNYVTTAVGTAFKLQTDHTLKKLKVELEEGKVTIEKKKGSYWSLIATLNPKESISLGENHHLPVSQKFSDKDFSKWKIQEVIFQDAPIKEVLLQLEIYYNVSITVENDAVIKDNFNGKFRHDSLQAVMEMICFSINRQFKFIDSNHIIIY